MKNMCTVCTITFALVIIGALNWGLVGLGDFLDMNLNVVDLLLGKWPMVESVVYILVGLSAVAKLFNRCACSHK